MSVTFTELDNDLAGRILRRKRAEYARAQAREGAPAGAPNPLTISLMIHCHAYAEPVPNQHAPAVRDAMTLLWEAGLIEPVNSASGWRSTEGGRLYLEMLQATPFPVPGWRDPRVTP